MCDIVTGLYLCSVYDIEPPVLLVGWTEKMTYTACKKYHHNNTKVDP